MDRIYNPATGRFVLRTGIVGKKVLSSHQNHDDTKTDQLAKKTTSRIINRVIKTQQKIEEKERIEVNKVSARVTKKIFDKILRNEKKIYEKNADYLSRKIVRDIFKDIVARDASCSVNNENKHGILLTEDLGKIFEKSICLLYDTPYVGKYKYGDDRPRLLKERIQKLKTLFPDLTHTAEKGGLHDFTSQNATQHLSAKTSKKKDGKIAPQKIGQATRKKFLEYFGLPLNYTDSQIKSFIIKDVANILTHYFKFTFSDKLIYYNEAKDIVMFVENIRPVVFDSKFIEFGCVRKQREWNEGTIVFYKDNRLGEFQIHNHRNCVKFRWFFENLLNFFPDNFKITLL